MYNDFVFVANQASAAIGMTCQSRRMLLDLAKRMDGLADILGKDGETGSTINNIHAANYRDAADSIREILSILPDYESAYSTLE